MAKKYDLGKSSDMRKFQRDFEKDIKRQTEASISDLEFDVECPNCSVEFKAKSGLNRCPSCNEEVNLTLDYDF